MVAIEGADVDGNAAGDDGGGIYCTGSVVRVTNGNVENNTSGDCGGGMHVQSGSAVTISGGSITQNTALTGGGIYVQGNLDGYNTTVDVIGGEISYNSATGRGTYNGQGGGIHADRFVTVTVKESEADAEGNVTVGKITNNTAAKGGGVYVCWGAVLDVNNGYITYNNAVGTPSGKTTAYHENHGLLGVGGGVYVTDGYTADNKSTFSLTGDKIAIYGNLAEFGADDVFANGVNTELNVPVVDDMELSGLGFKPEGWFEDYPVNDSRYLDGLKLGTDKGITNGNVFRYKGSEVTERVEIEASGGSLPANTPDTYVCMTLGIGSGKLKISKTVDSNNGTVDPNQYFLFTVESESFLYEQHTPVKITVMVKAGGSVTIRDLPYGTYKVTEETGWSTRYESVDGNPVTGILVNEKANEEPAKVTFENKLTNDKWLSGDAYADNAFGHLEEEEG